MHSSAAKSSVVRMAYPGEFVRLVLYGDLYEDTWNSTLAIVPSALGELEMPAVDQTTLDAVAADVLAWWNATTYTTGPMANPNAYLNGIKLNRLDSAGHYMDPVTREKVYPTRSAGKGANLSLPPQITIAHTLVTAVPRGRGARGRMYLPPQEAAASLNSEGKLTPTSATNCATSLVALINALNTTYALIGKVGVASNAGTGRFEHVTKVQVGRTVDTMRSRRNRHTEDPPAAIAVT